MSAISPISGSTFFGLEPVRRNIVSLDAVSRTQPVADALRTQVGLELLNVLAEQNFPARSGRPFETGRLQDVSIQGEGFFGLRLGDNTVFSRSISLGLDSLGNVIDSISGARLLERTDTDDVGLLQPFQLSQRQQLLLIAQDSGIHIEGNLGGDFEIGQIQGGRLVLRGITGDNLQLSLEFSREGDREFLLGFRNEFTNELLLGFELEFDQDGNVLDIDPVIPAEQDDRFPGMQNQGTFDSDNISFDDLSFSEEGNTAITVRQQERFAEQLPNGLLTIFDGNLVISTDPDQQRRIGEVTVVDFDDPQTLLDVGNSLLTRGPESDIPRISSDTTERFRIGQLELFRGIQTSNVIEDFLRDQDFLERRRTLLRDPRHLLGELFDFFA